MSPELQNRIARLGADRESGASQLLQEALAILREAFKAPADVVEVARAVCLAQPSMGSMWNAAEAAMAGKERFEQFATRVARAPEAVARFALDLFGQTAADQGLRLVTISASGTVLQVLLALARRWPLHVACSEGRPALEGRTLATTLAANGVDVTFFGDAAIGHALERADALVLGADAVASDFFLNKSGTRMLAAAASQQGLPCYVVATRDKFVSRETAPRLQPREGASSEIWSKAPPGIAVRNPYFEATPLDLVAGLVTDLGVLGPADAGSVCG
jgi:translation initiation factor 2B subunit (eIF-2B alpha/beta/delta family)